MQLRAYIRFLFDVHPSRTKLSGWSIVSGQIARLVFVFSLLAHTSLCYANLERERKITKFFMSKPGFANITRVIADINSKMHQAAENPMDEWRRDDVRNAISQLPGAIMGLAAEFRKGALHDGDLPKVQSMLGGFVDMSFGRKFKEFMKKPSKSLIPEVGEAVASTIGTSSMVEHRGSAGTNSVDGIEITRASGTEAFVNEKASSGGMDTGEISAEQELSSIANSDFGLKGENTQSSAATATTQDNGSLDKKQLVVDESSEGQVGSGGESGIVNLAAVDTDSGTKLAIESSIEQTLEQMEQKKQFENDILGDINALEAKSRKAILVPKDEEDELSEEQKREQEEKLDEGVFELSEHLRRYEELRRHGEEQAEEGKPVSENNEGTEQVTVETASLQVKAQPWRGVLSAIRVAKLLTPKVAKAEGAGQALQAIAGAVGTAAQAAATAGVAAINADRDKFIATEAANANVTQTARQSQAVEKVSENQLIAESGKTQAVKEISLAKMRTETEQLGMQISAQMFANEQDRAERREIRLAEQRQLDLQLALAQDIFRQRNELARLQIAMNSLNANNVITPRAPRNRVNVANAGGGGGGGLGSFRGGGSNAGARSGNPLELAANGFSSRRAGSAKFRPRNGASEKLFRAINGKRTKFQRAVAGKPLNWRQRLALRAVLPGSVAGSNRVDKFRTKLSKRALEKRKSVRSVVAKGGMRLRARRAVIRQSGHSHKGHGHGGHGHGHKHRRGR